MENCRRGEKMTQFDSKTDIITLKEREFACKHVSLI